MVCTFYTIFWGNSQFKNSQIGFQVIGVFSCLRFHIALQSSQILWVVSENGIKRFQV